MSAVTSHSEPSGAASAGSARAAPTGSPDAVRDAFFANGDGEACVRTSCAAADALVVESWNSNFAPDARLALFAVGGYGRGELFPFSDIDLLILAADKRAETQNADAVRSFTRALWDAGMRVAATTRTVEECQHLGPENSEFAFALLDVRPLAGSSALANDLFGNILPGFVQRERTALLRRLVELSSERHAKCGHTIFHLEPNIKDTPGTLRDLHTIAWLARLLTAGAPGVVESEDYVAAHRFFTAVRCFLHYRARRDDNVLYWALQDEAAAARIGLPWRPNAPPPDPAQWMRICFRHARSVQKLCVTLLNEAAAESSSVYQKLRRWTTTPAQDGYRISRAQIRERQALTPREPLAALRLYIGVARTGLPLNRDAENAVATLMPSLSEALEPPLEYEYSQQRRSLSGEGASAARAEPKERTSGAHPPWLFLSELLPLPHASTALRTMHSIGLLELMIPEFHGIDALVIRDAYHRYTVDEHTFIVLDRLQELTAEAPGKMDPARRRFALLAREIEDVTILRFAALMHDVGKGGAGGHHTEISARLTGDILRSWNAPVEQRQAAVHLVREHLAMGAALRRDVFDPAVVAALARSAYTPEMLRMLTLLTWADIQAVHPDALTPFKAESLWQLYIATANYLDHSLDDTRIGPAATEEAVDPDDAARYMLVMTQHGELGMEMVRFLDGLPSRYLRTHSPEEIGAHCRMNMQLNPDNQAEARTVRVAGGFELAIVSTDRPQLFARIAAALAAHGMNILKAAAFTNRAAIAVDTFRFSDTYGTLEQNPEEMQRFERSLLDALQDHTMVGPQLASRTATRRKRARKRAIAPRVTFDNSSSAHNTVLQVVAQDTPGLLSRLSAVLAANSCDISTALIDTEGEEAIDVFYLTRDGAPLAEDAQKALCEALLASIAEG